MKRKISRRKRVFRTVEQKAVLCKNAQQAMVQGKEVHRAWLQFQFEKMSPEQKTITVMALDAISKFPEEKQIELTKQFVVLKTNEEMINFIQTLNTEDNNEVTKENN
jgi:hypothetical protein